MTEETEQFPELEHPPIVEVVCGTVFDSIPDIDAFTLGVYWDSRKTDFPRRGLQTALTENATFAIGAFPMRAFLVSSDDQFVLQVQHDRLYVNWRARGMGYPRFSERHGPNGLLVRAMSELGKFGSFVEERSGGVVRPKRIELTKIDLLKKGEHWQDLADLQQLLPVTGALELNQHSESREVNLRFVERGPWGALAVHISTLTEGSGPTAVRVESSVSTPSQRAEMQATFARANHTLNRAFFKLIPRNQLHRFGAKESQA